MTADTVSATASAGLRGRLGAGSATASFCSGCGPTCTTGFSGATRPAGLSGTTGAAGTAGLSNTTCAARTTWLSDTTGASRPAGSAGFSNTTNATRAARTPGLSNTASTTCAARTAWSSGGSTLLVSGGLISVWRVAAMLRVVLPVLVRAVDIVLLVVVVYVLVIDVHVHVPVVPAAVLAPTSTPRSTGDVSRISDRRIRIRRSTVNSRGVIRRYVNRVGISGLNHDRLLTAVDRLRLNFLLRACL